MSSDDDDNEIDRDDARQNEATLAAFAREAAFMRESLQQAAHQHKRLSKQCQEARETNERLRSEFDVLTSGNQAMFMHIEAERYRKMGIAWWLFVAVTLTFTVGALQRDSYGWALFNFVAFLFIWRGLYVRINVAPMAAAMCLALLTIKFA